MTVRAAVAADKIRVVRLLKDAHAAGGLPAILGLPFSAPHASALFDQQSSHADRLCLIYDVAGTPQGVLMASAQDHPFVGIRYSAEVAWWIDPDHRGMSASRMLAAYEQWATERGCTVAGIVALRSAPRAGLIYERRGYTAAETHFLKPLAPAQAS
jgi:GNAT superfamily N-acetyltransferase